MVGASSPYILTAILSVLILSSTLVVSVSSMNHKNSILDAPRKDNMSATSSSSSYNQRGSMPPQKYDTSISTVSFQNIYNINGGRFATRDIQTKSRHYNNIKIQHHQRTTTTLLNNMSNNDDDTTSTSSSFLSTSKANVSFKSTSSNSPNSPSNLSSIDQLLLTLTSDRTSLLLGCIGIFILLINRLISFPEDAIYEASRSRIDLLGVFAAGSVLLNGLTKLDVESVVAERVLLEGINQARPSWNKLQNNNSCLQGRDEKFQSTVEWALLSFLKCTPARTAILLATQTNSKWIPLATIGILPIDSTLHSSIPTNIKTPILDRTLRDDSSGIKGGTVGGTEVIGSRRKGGPKESYLPTLQALPGKVEFTYLPSNAQEALILPVTRPDDYSNNDDGWRFAIVLGGDTAKSFAPRDIAWCKEISTLVGDRL